NPVSMAALHAVEAVAPAKSVSIVAFPVSTPEELPGALQLALREQAQGLLGNGADIMLVSRAAVISQVALEHRLPAIFAQAQHSRTGGLLSFNSDAAEIFRRAAALVNRILKGAKPADLPVEQPTKFELVVNLKTARALGLAFPPALLARADE